jgi:predicted helicase
LGEKRDSGMPTVFVDYSSGVKTNRDAWCYNASRLGLEHNVVRMIDFYNVEVNRFKSASIGLSKSDRLDPEVFVIKDTTKISWTREVYADVGKGHSRAFVPAGVYKSLYRPFTNQWMYFNQHFNNCVYQMPRMFPDTTVRNLVICVTGRGSTKGFSALMTDKVPDLEMVSKGQCFALKIYEPVPGLELPGVDVTEQVDLFASEPDKDATAQEYIGPTGRYWVNDGIGDAALAYFVQIYGGAKITKEDLFYYTYGLLHSEDYRARYADNLSKELPRLPPVKKFEDFQAFTAAGRKLAAIHVGFEDVAPHPITVEGGKLLLSTFTDADYRVTQMKFANKGDKTRVIYNHRITISDIPSEAFDYVVNGKPALEWVMERQAVTTHKDSGIVNDANQWAIETIGDASYPLQLFQKVITVSLETLKIVHGLPRLDLLVRTN